MKKIMKKLTAFALVMVMALTTVLFAAPNTMEVQAASSNVYFYPKNGICTYKPGDNYSKYWTVISIIGCEKKSQIKNLKSSNKAVTVEAKDGYVVAYFKDKAVRTTITCTAKGVKIKATLTVKKYTNPVKTFKVDKTNFTSKFNGNDTYTQKKSFKNKKVSLQVKNGWKISSVYVYNGGTTKRYTVNSTKFSKKISLTANYAYVGFNCYNTKTGVSESIYLYKSNY